MDLWASIDKASRKRGARITPADCLSFLNNPPRIFVISQRNKFGMTQMIRTGPFEEINPRDGFRPRPLCRMPEYAACIGTRTVRLQFCGYGPDSHTA